MGSLAATLSLSSNLPIGWDYHGCWTDYGRRKLAGPSYVDRVNMTQENCVAFCDSSNYAYAGIEYGQECWCGHLLGAGSEVKNDTECDFRCPGAADEACGAGYRLNVFFCGLLNTQVINPGPPGTEHLGCLTDSVEARALSLFQTSEDDMTVFACTSSCKALGYTLAGLEYSRQCFCGDSIDNNATMTDEGCDMTCVGNSSEFCGGADRLNLYELEAGTTIPAPKTSETSPLVPNCNPIAIPTADAYALNGGFEQGLDNWSAVAYDPNLVPFDIGLTNDALEGCTALTAVPRSGITAQSAHFQASTSFINMQPSRDYMVDLAIGHRAIVDQQTAMSDPKYTIRMSNRLLGRGTVCGFSSFPCPLTGLNNSTYMALSMQFQADSPTENLTVYLSWYNGNLDIPLYLDSVSVGLAPDDAFVNTNPSESLSQLSSSAPLVARSLIATETTSLSVTSTLIKKASRISNTVSAPFRKCSVLDPSVLTSSSPPYSSKSIPCPRTLPNSTRWSHPPPDITHKTLANSGFENGLRGWQFFPTGGTFDIATTNQSLEGCFAASIKPTSSHRGEKRAVTLQTHMSNLNSSHEWYTVELYIGYANVTHKPANGISPVISMRYKNTISGDIERSISLCGFARTASYNSFSQPCSLFGADGAQYQSYGMDVRAFASSDGRYTNATEMEISVEIVWPAEAVEMPVYVDGFGVWEIERGSISR